MKIVFAGAFAAKLAEPVRARLSLPCEVRAGSEAEMMAHLADADVLVSLGFTAAMAEAAPLLRLIQVPGAGIDRVDRAALRPGVHLANAYGHETGIAEHAIGAMIALSRSFARLDTSLREGRWESNWAFDRPAPPLWPELSGRALGILGFGHIGEALARRALAFDMRVSAIRSRAADPAPPGLRFVGGPERLDEVLRESDFVVVAVPLTDATRGLLDGRRLGLMKQGAVLVNVARAEIVEEAALFEALASGRLAGAALDVWWRYPTGPGPTQPSALPFATLPNVLMTPHVSGWTEGMLEARISLVAGNIARIACGEPPSNTIAPA